MLRVKCWPCCRLLAPTSSACRHRLRLACCPGVHLNISCVKKLMARHPDVLPFLVHIASEDKHVERMAVRAKYMTLDPHKNRHAPASSTCVHACGLSLGCQ